MESAAATSQPRAIVWFADVPFSKKDDYSEYRLGWQSTDFDDTNLVTILASPTNAETIRVITAIEILNRSTTTEIFHLVFNGLRFKTITLTTTQSLSWSENAGWQVMGP